MNRSKLLRFSIQLANSLSSTQSTQLTRLSSTQVTRLNPNFTPKKPHISNNYNNNLFNYHQNRFLSSKPESFIDIILSNDWSEKIEIELDKLNPNLAHEAVIYILMNLNTNPRKSLDFFKWVCVKKGFNPSFSGYFVLLRALACKEFMDEFWNVFLEMKKKGFYFDSKSYSTIHVIFTRNKLVKELVEWNKMYQEMLDNDVEKELANEVLLLIMSFDWGEDVEGLLRKKLEFPLTEKFVLRVIAELWDQPLKALRFFELIGSSGGYKHDIVTYNAMAQVLGHEDSVGEFWEFVKCMRGDGYEIDMLTYVRCSRHLPIKAAVELLEFMMDGPYQPSVQHSIALMARITRENEPHLDLVYRVFNKLVGAGVAPTIALYDGVHSTLCKLGRFDEAKNVVEELKSSGYKPDNSIYSQVISGLCKHGKSDEACKVIDQMEVEGCVPNAKTWKVLIQGHCEANRMDLALSSFAKMKKKKADHGPDILSAVIKGFISENKVLDAYRYFTEFIKDEGLVKVKPAESTYILMIERLAEAGNLEEALLILGAMKKQEYPIFPYPIIRYISKCGTVSDAKKLLNLMPQHSAVYRKVIGTFFEHGRSAEAKDLLLSGPPHLRNNKAMLAMFDSPQAPKMGIVARKECSSMKDMNLFTSISTLGGLA